MYTWSRRYTGRVRAVLLDWSGTSVDHGCLAPLDVLIEVFKRHGVTVTPSQAREPMGVHKREHVRLISEQPAVRRAWILRNGAPPNDDDINQMYAEANELSSTMLAEHAVPIPGMGVLLDRLAERGVRVGSTTGYGRAMLDVMQQAAARRGFRPEVAVSSSDVPAGRPAPWMLWRAAEQLGVWPAEACVAVGDTPLDVEAGLNAGMWTVGVVASGNLVGMTAREWATLEEERKQALREKATARLTAAGAHYVVDAAPFLLPVLDRIDQRLAVGERP